MRTRSVARRTPPSFDDLRVGARLLVALPRFLRTPIDPGAARAIVHARRANRRQRLLALARELTADPDSPYARLFASAGATVADVAEMSARDGVEAALEALLRQGVYLTVDELKGRRPVVRGSTRFLVELRRLVRPDAVVHGVAESSGSRGAPTPVPIDLAFVADHAVNTLLALAGFGGCDWRHAHYGVPGGTAVTNPLELAKCGNAPARWFTPVPLDARGLSWRYRIGARALRLGGRLAGVPLPAPITAPLDEPLPIVEWITDELVRGRTPHVWTFASSAVQICQAALRAGRDIAGVRFTAGGEPTTEARRAAIESTGAIVLPRMGATETDILAYACLEPRAADDMHFFDDRHALVQPGDAGPAIGVPSRALLLTSLLASAPLRLLNVCLGDQAVVDTRECGCALGREGWRVHVRQVRSFEKLTAGGIALLDCDVVRVLEEVLPARFGGGATDYQLVERLDGQRGLPEVRLLVAPAVGDLEERDVVECFLDAVGGGAGGERLMALQWREAGVLKVERGAPRRTSSSKVHHLHLESATTDDRS